MTFPVGFPKAYGMENPLHPSYPGRRFVPWGLACPVSCLRSGSISLYSLQWEICLAIRDQTILLGWSPISYYPYINASFHDDWLGLLTLLVMCVGGDASHTKPSECTSKLFSVWLLVMYATLSIQDESVPKYCNGSDTEYPGKREDWSAEKAKLSLLDGRGPRTGSLLNRLWAGCLEHRGPGLLISSHCLCLDSGQE